MQVNPLGQTAPTPKATPTTGKHPHSVDPAALHSEAANALMMAKFYAQRGNHAGAARKAGQALSALRKLAAFKAAAQAPEPETSRP